MKTTELKSPPALQRNSNAAPFFQPEESREGFFGSKQSNEPFFKANPPDGNNPKPSTIQAKLTIGAPDDVYEQEADAMADQAVQKITSGDDGSSIRRKCAQCAKDDVGKGITPKLQKKSIFESNEEPANERAQRKCEACSAETIQPLRIQRIGEEEEPALQAKGSVPGLQASSDLESRLNTTKGSGSPLPEDTRSSMESSFGTDFSGVRVHTNSGAVQMNQELGAQAFTHGSDVYFNSGKYEPGSQEGKGLLAHELTHVVQQNGGGTMQRKLAYVIQQSKRLAWGIQRAPDYTKPQTNVASSGITRFEVHELKFGTNKDFGPPTYTDKGVVKPSDERNKTDKSAKHMAVVLVPDALFKPDQPVSQVKIFLHFHGWGFRKGDPYAGYRVGKDKGGTVRDVAQDHLEQQIGAFLKGKDFQVVGILAQGVGKSDFGKIDTFEYVREVLLKSKVPALVKVATDEKYSVVLSAHSGGGSTQVVPKMRNKEAETADRTGLASQKAGKDGRVVNKLQPVDLIILFDALHVSDKSDDVQTVVGWVNRQLSRLVPVLKNASSLSDGKAVAELAATPKLRGYFESGYSSKYERLNKDICNSINNKVPVMWHDNVKDLFRIIKVKDPAGKRPVKHEEVISGIGPDPASGTLSDALSVLLDPAGDRSKELPCPVPSAPKPAPKKKSSSVKTRSNPATATAAPPINQKTIQPSRSMLIQTNHAPVSIQRDTPSSSGADSDMVKWMEDWNKTDSYQTARALFNDKGRPSGNPETRYKKLCPKYKNNGINRPLQYLSTKINYNTTFFGYKTHAHIGMQSMLAAAEKTLTDMKDGSGNPKYTASSFKQRPWALTVRTTSAGGWSNHADGKAIDLDPDTNAHLTNKTHRDVITALTGLDIEKSNPGKALGLESYEGNKLASDRFQAAFNEAGITKRIEELKPGEEKLKTERDELAKRQSDLAASKKQIDKDRDLALKNKSLTVKGRKDIKDKAKADRTAIDKQITGIKAQLKAKNAELKNAHKPIQTLEAELKRFKAEQKNFDAATKALETAEGEVTSPSELVKTLSIEKESLDTAQILATEQAKQAKDLVREGKKAKAANLADLQKELKTKNDDLAKARKAFKIKLDEFDKAQTLLKKKEKALADKKHKRDAFTLRKYQREGFVNLSKDIVAAMKGAGFRWGGDWGTDMNDVDHKDFMHFDMP